MKSTHRAMQVTRPGILKLVERQTPTPGNGEVVIEVEACGICGADIGDIEGADPALQPPRIPGHEVVGRNAALGAHTPSIWKLNQRVGIGRLGGHCNECSQCRQGHFQLCRNQPVVGATREGGYAEMMLARRLRCLMRNNRPAGYVAGGRFARIPVAYRYARLRKARQHGDGCDRSDRTSRRCARLGRIPRR